MSTSYNGWTNYETWRVNLELFDNMELSAHQDKLDAYSLSLELQDYVQEMIDENACSNSIVTDYAHAFVANVNWLEISKHLKGEYD